MGEGWRRQGQRGKMTAAQLGAGPPQHNHASEVHGYV